MHGCKKVEFVYVSGMALALAQKAYKLSQHTHISTFNHRLTQCKQQNKNRKKKRILYFYFGSYSYVKRSKHIHSTIKIGMLLLYKIQYKFFSVFSSSSNLFRFFLFSCFCLERLGSYFVIFLIRR